MLDAFAHYVVLSRDLNFDEYFVYTPHYEHWVAKIGLPELVFTYKGPEFINNGIITL